MEITFRSRFLRSDGIGFVLVIENQTVKLEITGTAWAGLGEPDEASLASIIEAVCQRHGSLPANIDIDGDRATADARPVFTLEQMQNLLGIS